MKPLDLKAFCVLAVLGLPTVILLSFTVNRYYAVHSASEMIVPIQGYDPRDLVFGRYIQFVFSWPQKAPDSLSVEEASRPYRFYIDERDGSWLDMYFRTHPTAFSARVKIVNGTIQIEQLLIDGRDYREVKAESAAGS